MCECDCDSNDDTVDEINKLRVHVLTISDYVKRVISEAHEIEEVEKIRLTSIVDASEDIFTIAFDTLFIGMGDLEKFIND